MKKFILLFSMAAISSSFGALCHEPAVDPCAKSDPEPASDCECNTWTPPSMFVPQHNLNVQHNIGGSSCGCGCNCSTLSHITCLAHLDFTPPTVTSLFCNCDAPVTPAPVEEEKGCVVEPEPEGLCPPTPKSTSASLSASIDIAYGLPVAAFTSAQVLNGTCFTADGGLLGMLELKLGKLNKKTATLKVAGKITDFNGKKRNARSVTVVVGEDNSFTCNLVFPEPVGVMPIKVFGGAAVPLADGVSSMGCTLKSCVLGGELRNGGVDFSFAGAAAIALPTGFNPVLDETAWNVKGTISKGTTLAFAKAKAPKVVKNEAGYAIAGLDAENVRALKLRYSKNTGLLKGDYTYYASDLGNTSGKPKLKKFKVKLGGFIYDGLCNGMATAPDGASVGAFTLQ